MHNLSRFAFFVGWMCMLWSYMEYFAEYTFSKWTVRTMLQNNPGLNINDEKRIELGKCKVHENSFSIYFALSFS